MKIAIVTSGHPPYDERIFYKFGLSFTKHKFGTAIICSTQEIRTETEKIKIMGFEGTSLSKKNKIDKFYKEIVSFDPSLVICTEPLTILAAHRYRKLKPGKVKIIYDITEYYPHQNMLDQYSGFLRSIQHLKLSLFNAFVANLADYLFIGEEGKAKLYYLIAPTIKKAIISYYPPEEYFQYSPPPYDGKHFTLCYTGNDLESGGFVRFANLVKRTAERFKDKIIICKIIGVTENPDNQLIKEISAVQNLRVIWQKRVDYQDYSSVFKDVDLCIDLRDKNIVFNKSLPIKVFDYMACGKPFICSDLDSFKDFKDIGKAGLLVDPEFIEPALERIELYLNNPDKLKDDSLTAIGLFREKYNWGIIEIKLIGIIESIFKSR